MLENNQIDIASLDVIFNRMLETITSSKDDVFIISEQSRRNFEEMQQELEVVRHEIKIIIDESDNLEKLLQLSRQRLVIVSKSFNNHSEEQIRAAYENTSNLQLKVSLCREREKQLRDKRDDLERRLRALYDTIERADHIVNQVNVVINFLTTDLKNVGAALEQAKIKQDFGIRIIAAQEEERKRLSREIHDGPAQMMANVLMRSNLIDRTFREKGADAALKEIHDLKISVRNALSEVRRIIYDLRPMALDDLGIDPTLKKYLSTIMEYNPGVEIQFLSYNNERRIPSDYEVAVFRLVQESVNNALKHGKPNLIIVKLEWLCDEINVVVKDNGVGFDTESAREGSFGIIGMKERIDLLKGSLKISSSIGKGTTILMKIPLPTKDEEIR
ncbi:signal transduction histidine kinase [Solibacillus silvestris StLB046]|uniref:Signal transduction histidine-protein kinase/phosphatase DegS n=1 Tax=Solibacillus silvestris (strain StLB046) TaxID=1002809 RepID=F2F330_SOLSS|nr:sensor histidine kinase [Solibacillus silvestris]BAK17718.1 signal transduction histidine kinase [Solibacillus silvestris StLB046]